MIAAARPGFCRSAMLMYAGLAVLHQWHRLVHFGEAAEILTIGSYFLIMRGQRWGACALLHPVLTGGGFCLSHAAFALAAQGRSHLPLSELSADVPAAWRRVIVLLAINFITKTASIGLHIWLPAARAEAETDVSPMVSGILLKAGLFGLFMLLMNMGKQQLCRY